MITYSNAFFPSKGASIVVSTTVGTIVIFFGILFDLSIQIILKYSASLFLSIYSKSFKQKLQVCE